MINSMISLTNIFYFRLDFIFMSNDLQILLKYIGRCLLANYFIWVMNIIHYLCKTTFSEHLNDLII